MGACTMRGPVPHRRYRASGRAAHPKLKATFPSARTRLVDRYGDQRQRGPSTLCVADLVGQGVFLRGTVTGPRMLKTELGELGTTHGTPRTGVVDVLLRPDDIVHDDESPWRAEVATKAFRGADFLYTLKLCLRR